MMTIDWAKSDGGENWASYNGYVNGRVRFHIIGERFGSRVNGWGLRDLSTHTSYADRARFKDAKKTAQRIIDKEDAS